MGALALPEGVNALYAALEEDKKNVTKGKNYLSRKAREIKSQNIETSYHVEIGEPAETIMKFGKKKHIDVTIMTSHGKGGFKRAVMGSITDEVTRGSHNPVLVIRPKQRGNK